MAEKKKPLSPTQQALLDYIKDGGVVRYIGGIDARYFKSPGFVSCSSAACALIRKGYAKHSDGPLGLIPADGDSHA